MNGIVQILFNNFGKVIALIVILTLAFVAIFKVNIKFDLNEFIKTKRAKNALKAQHYCPHMEFQKVNGQLQQVSWYESPVGTANWICKNCQNVTNRFNDELEQKNGTYWLKNIKKYKKNLKKYNRYAKKSL